RLQHLSQQQEVALSVLLLPEEGRDDLASGVIDGGQEGAGRVVEAEPGVGAAVNLEQDAFLGPAVAALAMLRRPVGTLGLLARLRRRRWTLARLRAMPSSRMSRSWKWLSLQAA
ncbi:MAG TPA: hypothetical protein VNN10_01285, partial [Dehalococcoidia bacterium]|nr:hypothetical protein [Dehalococcoidia bacterium]